jgi:hypothetical protein
VEGNDLTVRGDTVCLKTLGGLRRVHAIFRRLDDDFCDPVELRADSALGVPGLIAVVRAGNVVIANASRQRRARVGGVDGLHPRSRRALAGRDIALAVGRDVVVRRESSRSTTSFRTSIAWSSSRPTPTSGSKRYSPAI